MSPRRSARWVPAFSLAALLAYAGAPAASAQEESEACEEITISGLLEEDGFPLGTSLYENILEEGVRGQFVSEDGNYFIWYCPTEPTEYTADTPDAAITACVGHWLVSSYPVGDTFNDLVWYQAEGGAQCQTTPVELDSSDWLRVERESVSDALSTSDATVEVECYVEDEDEGDGDSNKSVIVLLIIIGVGFMVLMCLGALACCIKGGRSSPEQAVMPPGELGEGSAIGGKVGDATKPGLHAHPEIRGAQHPRPEDWAPSYSSNRSIPLGSRSGPSVRSIGYS